LQHQEIVAKPTEETKGFSVDIEKEKGFSFASKVELKEESEIVW
jgi:hypothetical protein